jgi:hypothetical protein
MTTVCTCNPDVNWIRFIVERVSDFSDSIRDQMATMPLGEWLGSSADEGRAKLRKA